MRKLYHVALLNINNVSMLFKNCFKYLIFLTDYLVNIVALDLWLNNIYLILN